MKNLLPLLFTIWTFALSAQEFYYPPTTSDDWETLNMTDLGWCESELPALQSFLQDTHTKAFLVLKDGKIVIEEYFDGHARDSVWYWASAGKSLNAFEIGLLQEGGQLDIEAPTSDYLGDGWTSCSSADEELIKVKHQLSMTTGLDYSVADIDCTTPDCLQCLYEPNVEWYYHNAPYTLLSDVIENVSGRSHSLHTFLTLGNSVGIRGAWLPLGNNRTFFSSARVMARFGLLMNSNGNWNGEAILADESYFDQMISPSQDINLSYGYLWWLNTGPSYRLPSSTITFPGKIISNAPDHIYMALGKNSQLLIIDPVENIVIVRMGEDPDPSPVPTIFLNDLWNQVQALICTTTAATETYTQELTISPNPVSSVVSIDTKRSIGSLKITDAHGRVVLSCTGVNEVDVSMLPAGVYMLLVYVDGTPVSEQFVKL